MAQYLLAVRGDIGEPHLETGIDYDTEGGVLFFASKIPVPRMQW